ncbi:hypothetical protein Zmor_005538 [Zophobas morio]|uniref:OPA3-like protein n=1 Tax=Zophobas morio TaxID=2755281 RepID=A0AA38INI9_9CUCU|nr:hypothetical protein Zmor_005538 [Zophobas morio]
MVVHVFPVAKLGALLIKQISKPIANAVKQGAKSSPVFRKYVCLPPAQFYNWCETKTKMWLLHLGQPVNLTVLNEAASIELGANLLGETVIFAIAAGILVLEYNRSSKKEAAKEEARLKEIQDLKDSLRDLFIQTEEQGAHIRELTRQLGYSNRGGTTKVKHPEEFPPKKEPPQGPPQLIPPSRKIKEVEENVENTDLLVNSNFKPLRGVIFKAISSVENTMLFDPHGKREPGVIMTALNLLYKDVYHSRLTF